MPGISVRTATRMLLEVGNAFAAPEGQARVLDAA
jgi:hypothetical protein